MQTSANSPGLSLSNRDAAAAALGAAFAGTLPLAAFMSQAGTSSSGLWIPFVTAVSLYLFLSGKTVPSLKLRARWIATAALAGLQVVAGVTLFVVFPMSATGDWWIDRGSEIAGGLLVLFGLAYLCIKGFGDGVARVLGSVLIAASILATVTGGEYYRYSLNRGLSESTAADRAAMMFGATILGGAVAMAAVIIVLGIAGRAARMWHARRGDEAIS